MSNPHRLLIHVKCPYCGYETDRAGALNGDYSEMPSDGDISLCGRCHEIGLFDVNEERVRVRRVTEKEANEVVEYLQSELVRMNSEKDDGTSNAAH